MLNLCYFIEKKIYVINEVISYNIGICYFSKKDSKIWFFD